ncbi:TSCPD domain-containing protein [bacterium]|nr:TSCPD domain-containing protein [bacterium]
MLRLSKNAIRVLERRYLSRDARNNLSETPEMMFRRVAENIAAQDKLYSPESDTTLVAEEFYRLMINLEFIPNSPTLMNAGKDMQQLSACFVLPVEDSMESIFESVKNAALIHKSGGGTGFSFSRIRPKNDIVRTTNGCASGPVSFMKVFNAATEAVKQGGTRRGANMAVLRVDHPDIMDFIHCKQDTRELTNFNISVALTDAFMQAVEAETEYDLIHPRTQQKTGTLSAGLVFAQIVKNAWETGEPGIVFIDQINKYNPTPQLGGIESTNPCFTGSMRLATDQGLSTFEELYIEQLKIKVATDNRVAGYDKKIFEGQMLVRTRPVTGITFRPAVPVFKTRANWPVFRLETKDGYEVTTTADHKFITPRGRMKLKELKPGDEILMQSGRGAWGKDNLLPPFFPDNKLKARLQRGECKRPETWSRDLGQLLGWIIGDGWVSREIPSGRNIPNYTVGLMFGNEEKKELAPAFRSLIKSWLGLNGTSVERNGTYTLYYKSVLYYFLNSLGITLCSGLEKEVPKSLWTAPREAVLGFLQALFTADGTVNASLSKGCCSIRLANSSKKLLQQIQIMLLNEGLAAKLKLRRKPGVKFMPDSKRQPKLYHYAAQYELIIDGANRDKFIENIGFMLPAKQKKAEEWIASKKRNSNKEYFVDQVKEIVPAGREDVYCTTEPETHSVVSNGFVTAQCGEQPLLPYEACNLGSINFSVLVTDKDGAKVIDYARLRRIVKSAVHFLDNVIDASKFPLPQIEAVVKKNRKIGLGVMGFADLLLKLGIPYNSERALATAESIMQCIAEESRQASRELAVDRGPFPEFARSRWAKQKLPPQRNATTTTIAPTGTISIIANTSSGIEPLFAVSYVRNVMDNDQLVEVNPIFEEKAILHDFASEELMQEIAKKGSVQGMEAVPPEMRKIFVTAHDMEPLWHIRMQAVFQKHTDNAVSKTVNFAQSATEADVKEVFLEAYRAQCKGVTIYRDGSREGQVLSTSAGAGVAAGPGHKLEPRDRPEVVSGITEKIKTGCGNYYITMNHDEKGLFEVFTQMGKSGGCAAAQSEAIARLISLALRADVNPEAIIKNLRGLRCSSPAWSAGGMVLSCPDAVGLAMENIIKWQSNAKTPGRKKMSAGLNALDHLIGACPECGGTVEHESGCVVCRVCGFSKCA